MVPLCQYAGVCLHIQYLEDSMVGLCWAMYVASAEKIVRECGHLAMHACTCTRDEHTLYNGILYLNEVNQMIINRRRSHHQTNSKIHQNEHSLINCVIVVVNEERYKFNTYLVR